MRTVAGLALVAFAVSARAAADEPAAPAAETPAAPARAIEATGEACPPEVQQAYERAFENFAAGDNAAAQFGFMEVVKKCPAHPHAAELARLAASRAALTPMEERAGPVHPEEKKAAAAAPPNLRGPEQATALARGELVAVQTLHGVGQGLLGCIAIGSSCTGEPRALVGLALLGGVVGAAGSFFLSLDGITPGRALAVNAGSGWGFWEGLSISQVLNLFSSNGQIPAAIMAGGAALGTAIGALIALEIVPTDGQVSIANTAGIWAGVTTLFIFMATGATFNTQTFFMAEMVASNIGLAGGAVLGAFYPVSRGRMFLVDAGGVLGMLLGMGVAVLIGGSSPTQSLFGGLAAAGTVVGLGASGYITHFIDNPNAAPPWALAPVGPGGNPGLTIAAAF